MTLRLYKNKRDAVEKQLVKLMRKCGLTVHLMDKPCDALVGWRGQNHLVDFKTKPKDGFTVNQQKFNDAWRGEKIWIVRDSKSLSSVMLEWTVLEARQATETQRRNRTITRAA